MSFIQPAIETFEQDGCKVKIEEGFSVTVTRIGKTSFKQKRDEYTREHPPDVELQAGSKEKRIQAHKTVLQESIPYFKAMFSNNFQESSQSVIDLGEDLDLQAASKIVDFVYKGYLHVQTSDIQSVFQLADQWDMPNIKNICISFMIREIDATNCLDLLHLAQMHSCEELIKPCELLIAQQFQAVTYTPSFLQLPAHLLSSILVLDNLHAGPLGEEFILSAVMSWYHHNEMDRRDSLADVLFHVVISKVPEKVRRECLDDPSIRCLPDVQKRLQCCDSESVLERTYVEHFMVIGGYLQSRTGPTCPRTNTVEKFDSESSQFVPLKKLEKEPSYGVAFNLLGKIVYVAVYIYPDPVTNKRKESAAVWTYNPIVNMWRELPDVISETALNQIVKCLVDGGTVLYCAYKSVIYALHVSESMLIDVHCRDGEISCDKRTILPSLLSKLDPTHHGIKGVTHKGQLFVMGGFYGPEMEREFSSTVLTLSSDGTEWEPRSDMLIPRSEFCVVSFGDKLFVTGGYGGREQRRRQQSCEYYVVEKDEWHSLPQLRQSRSHHSTVVVNGRLYTIGGKSYASQKLTGMGGWHPGGARIVSDYVELFDPSLIGSEDAEWNRLTRMARSRCNFATVVV